MYNFLFEVFVLWVDNRFIVCIEVLLIMWNFVLNRSVIRAQLSLLSDFHIGFCLAWERSLTTQFEVTNTDTREASAGGLVSENHALRLWPTLKFDPSTWSRCSMLPYSGGLRGHEEQLLILIYLTCLADARSQYRIDNACCRYASPISMEQQAYPTTSSPPIRIQVGRSRDVVAKRKRYQADLWHVR